MTNVTNIQAATNPLAVGCANNKTMYSTHTCNIPIPGVSPAACAGHLFPDMDLSLLSVGLLADDGCTIQFNATKVTVTKNSATILQGFRDPLTGLWMINLDNPNVAFKATNNKDLVLFHHASLWSPAASTMQAAIQRGFLRDFPGLTLTSFKKNLPHTIPQAKGHMDQARKNQRSTKPATPQLPPGFDASILDDDSSQEDAFPTDAPNRASHFCYAAIIEHSSQAHGDLTGAFPLRSSTGKRYLFVLYDYDSNEIEAEPISDRTGPSIVAAYRAVYIKLAKAGLKPLLQRLDNECSAAVKDFFQEEGTS